MRGATQARLRALWRAGGIPAEERRTEGWGGRPAGQERAFSGACSWMGSLDLAESSLTHDVFLQGPLDLKQPEGSAALKVSFGRGKPTDAGDRFLSNPGRAALTRYKLMSKVI